jgi:cell wall-associated NlpC family hydrolase
MAVNVNRFIGIKWEFNRSDFAAADCSGLAALFYREHGWKPDDYPKPQQADWYKTQPFYMERFLLKHFNKTRKIAELEYGDLIVVRINGETHLFIYLNHDRVLTTFKRINEFSGGVSFIDRFEKYWLALPDVQFVAGFKRRKEDA